MHQMLPSGRRTKLNATTKTTVRITDKETSLVAMKNMQNTTSLLNTICVRTASFPVDISAMMNLDPTLKTNMQIAHTTLLLLKEKARLDREDIIVSVYGRTHQEEERKVTSVLAE